MVWWRSARSRVPWLVFAVIASCTVDDEGYVYDPLASGPGEGGEGPDLGAAGEGGPDSAGGAGTNAAGGRTSDRGGRAGSVGGSPATGGVNGQGAKPATAGGTGGVVSNGGSPGETGGTTEPAPSSGGSATTPGDCDCEDPDCGARVCVPAAPSGWSGPILVFQGVEVWRPECEGDVDQLSFEGGTLPVQEELRCYGCSCGELTGAGCSLSYTTFSDASCKTQIDSVDVTTTCTATPQASYFKMSGLEAQGSCQPSGGGLVSSSTAVWDELVRGCGPSNPVSAGCGPESVCMPEPYGTFEDEICIHRAGSQSCPSDYPTKHTYLTRLVDDRACPTCACEITDTCGGDILTGHNNPSCAVNGASDLSEYVAMAPSGVCREVETSFTPLALRLKETFAPNSCSPRAVEDPDAVIRGEDPITVCCR